MNHLSLFSGIGGFDLAAEWMGWNNIAHCEINPFCRRVLNYYWPKSISYADIKTTDFTIHRGTIDIITGGFPCQPFSQAGKRKGTDDDRHLWPEMLRAIREISPRWIVGENVYGITNWNGGLVFEQVQSDLETQGYEVQPIILPAVSVNADHRRDRVWFVTHSKCDNDFRTQRSEYAEEKEVARIDGTKNSSSGEFSRTNIRNDERVDQIEYATDSYNQGLQGCEIDGGITEFRPQRNEQPARFLRTNWEEFPTKSPIRSRNDGISTELDGYSIRKHYEESIKAYGNAIVPQVAYQIFQTIQKYENDNQ